MSHVYVILAVPALIHSIVTTSLIYIFKYDEYNYPSLTVFIDATDIIVHIPSIKMGLNYYNAGKYDPISLFIYDIYIIIFILI